MKMDNAMILKSKLRESVKHERRVYLADADKLQSAIDLCGTDVFANYLLARVRGMDWRAAVRATLGVDSIA